MRNMTEVEAAWTGAMIEAEGSVRRCGRRVPRRLTVCSTDVETIATLLRLTGIGRVYSRSIARMPHAKKPQWEWTVSRQADIDAVLTRVAPYLITKQPSFSG